MIDSFVALDVETTGLNPAQDKIIEIGMVKVCDGIVTDQYKSFINPGIKLPLKITQLTGIHDGMLKGQPTIEELIEEIIEFIGDAPILGHNVLFDYSFIKKAAVNHKMTFEKKGIDTLKIARRLLPETPHKNLDYLCACFHIDPGSSHRAYDDAVSAMKLYLKLYEINPLDHGFEEAAPLVFQVKKDSPITPAQKRYLTDLIVLHSIVLPEDVNTLTKSKASKLIDGILSTYGRTQD
jgi:DNA polymerase-3 subunit alpha (Gram-positive type)